MLVRDATNPGQLNVIPVTQTYAFAAMRVSELPSEPTQAAIAAQNAAALEAGLPPVNRNEPTEALKKFREIERRNAERIRLEQRIAGRINRGSGGYVGFSRSIALPTSPDLSRPLPLELSHG